MAVMWLNKDKTPQRYSVGEMCGIETLEIFNCSIYWRRDKQTSVCAAHRQCDPVGLALAGSITLETG